MAVSIAEADPAEIEIEFYPHDDASQGHPIRLTVEAEHIPGGRAIRAAVQGEGSETLEGFLATYIEAFKSGTIDDVVRLWRVSEQPAARSRMERAFDGHRAAFASVREMRLYVVFRYGKYFMATVEVTRDDGSKSVTAFPLIETDDGFVMSNALHDDPMFQILFFAFLDGMDVDQRLRTIN